MNDITRSDFGNNGWTACEFVYSLLNGGEYRLRYWKRGGERVVACVDLYNSIGEEKSVFSRCFDGCIFATIEMVFPSPKNRTWCNHQGTSVPFLGH